MKQDETTLLIYQRRKMPPQLPSHHHSPITPNTHLLFQVSPKSRLKKILHQKIEEKMKFTKKNLIPLLIFILSTASIFRFLKITIVTTSSAPLTQNALPPIHRRTNSQSPSKSSLTKKETKFLLKFFSHKLPCDLLIFGRHHQYSNIASLNSNGTTIFLEDNLQKSRNTRKSNNTQIYRITYSTKASEAYVLLKDARENPYCKPEFDFLKGSKCNLALTNLPHEVYDTKWDVVLVDGPEGGSPDSQGRMAAIYTASVLARRGNKSHVFVHDVNRMIEKWFSWEFLCEENLVASKGRFWHFEVLGVANATKFCSA